jgi:TolB protein
LSIWRTLGAATSVSALLVCSPAAHSTAERSAPLVGRIAYERLVFLTAESGSDRTDVWVMNASGSRQRSLTGGDRTFLDGQPDWSPDGRRIAFTSFRGPGGIGIYTMKADGSDVRRVTRRRLESWNPSWSPDGRLIAFDTGESYPGDGIYVMRADGSRTRRLTPKGVAAMTPDWSPDGRRIAFVRWTKFFETKEIYVMNADGTGARRLTRNRVEEETPRWSPDGRWLAFHRSGKSAGLYVIRLDGTGLRKITGGGQGGLAWSPDGKHIAFERKADIYVVPASRGAVRQLTRGTAWESSPTWSPVG